LHDRHFATSQGQDACAGPRSRRCRRRWPQGERWRAWLVQPARAALESLREQVCCGHRLGRRL
jgi:hypothetical protein